MDQKITVKVGKEFHIFAESDITVVPSLHSKGEIKEVFVEVTYAGKTIRGTVSASESKKLLPETSAKNRRAKTKKEEEEEKKYPIVVIDKPKMRRDSE
jgi:hypothetical protein